VRHDLGVTQNAVYLQGLILADQGNDSERFPGIFREAACRYQKGGNSYRLYSIDLTDSEASNRVRHHVRFQLHLA